MAPIQQNKEISCTHCIKDRSDCCRLPLHSKKKTEGAIAAPACLLYVIFQQQTVNALLQYFDFVTVGCTIRQFLVEEKLDLLSNFNELHNCSGAVQQQRHFLYHKRTFLFGPVWQQPYGSF